MFSRSGTAMVCFSPRIDQLAGHSFDLIAVFDVL